MEINRPYTSIYFGENQLSPGLISLSLRSTGHHLNFQLECVRPSTQSYPRFSLPMDRSPGFGSAACDYVALFRLAFASASPNGLTLPQTTTRWLIMQKVRSRTCKHSAPTACRHTVSGSFHSPHRGSFHLSLTVLVHYRSPGST